MSVGQNGIRASTVRSERSLFMRLATLIAALVIAGFSRTYYFHGFFGVPGPSSFLHIHGAVMSGWIVIYFGQSFLVSKGQIRLHRKFGSVAAAYAALVVLMGVTATVLSARREVRAHSAEVPGFLNVLGLELTQMLMFAALVSLAVWLRNRTDYHKRLMLLATLCMLPNPIVRLAILVGINRNIEIMAVWALLVVAVGVVDTLRTHTLHPVFKVGSTAIIGLLYCAYFASRTPWWQHFAARAVS